MDGSPHAYRLDMAAIAADPSKIDLAVHLKKIALLVPGTAPIVTEISVPQAATTESPDPNDRDDSNSAYPCILVAVCAQVTDSQIQRGMNAESAVESIPAARGLVAYDDGRGGLCLFSTQCAKPFRVEVWSEHRPILAVFSADLCAFVVLRNDTVLSYRRVGDKADGSPELP